MVCDDQVRFLSRYIRDQGGGTGNARRHRDKRPEEGGTGTKYFSVHNLINGGVEASLRVRAGLVWGVLGEVRPRRRGVHER